MDAHGEKEVKMEKYAKDEKDACALEKKILIAALELKRKEYRQKALKERDNDNVSGYHYWSAKSDAIQTKIQKVAQMPCDQLEPSARDEGIDLPEIVLRYYPGMLDEQNKQDVIDGMKSFFDHLNNAAEIMTNFDARTKSVVGQWRSHINNLVNFNHNQGISPDGSFITPWYYDHELHNRMTQQLVAGGTPSEIIDTRIPLVIAYENEWYEFFKSILEQEGPEFLANFIHAFLDSERLKELNTRVFSIDHESEAYKEWSIEFIEYITQGSAFRRVEGWEQMMSAK